jgi:hypothetical protein
MILKPLDKEEFATLRTKWMKLLKAHNHPVFEAEYQQIFGIIEATGCWDDLKLCMNKPIFRCVFDESGDEWAIVELVQSRKGSMVWIKMLDMHLSPKIEVEADTEANTQKRLKIFRAALVGIFELTKSIKKADTVKVFGRTEALVMFLRGMHDSISVISSLGTIQGIDVSIEGRWLVFRASKVRK